MLVRSLLRIVHWANVEGMGLRLYISQEIKKYMAQN